MSIVKKEAIYNISAHGGMFSSVDNIDSDNPRIKYYACDIPKNVELYTYTEIGLKLACTFTSQDFICPPKRKLEDNNRVLLVEEPRYKFISPSKFPNLFLNPESDNNKRFYSGITFCNKDNPNENNSEVIYNIDAKNRDNCVCNIVSISKDKQKDTPYDCDKKYSEFYKTRLKKDTRMCGPILLEDAIQIILAHSKTIYHDDEVTIKIYLHTCLTLSNLSCHVHQYLYVASIDKTKAPDDFNLEILGYGFVKKLIISTNTVDNIDEFRGETIVRPSNIVKLRFNRTLFIITISDIDITKSITKKTLPEYRYILKDKLEKILTEYIRINKAAANLFPQTIELSLTSLTSLTIPFTPIDTGSKELKAGLESLLPKLKVDSQDVTFTMVGGDIHKHKT